MLTGGGDCPGLNAVIRAVVRKGVFHYHDEFVGFMEGWRGLIEDQSMPLDLDAVSGILPRGGTILRTSRTNPSKRADGIERCVATVDKHKIDALVAIGGDDTLSVAQKLHEHGVKVVGVPKTIDNDLCATEVTFGFDTALHTATDAVDKIHTTAESHHRVMVVEVMGRDAGWIAIEAGIAGGAHVILIPEIPFSVQKICEHVALRESFGKRFTIIVAAEGIKLPLEWKEKRRTGSVGPRIGDAVAAGTGKEVRVSVLGHIQRGGSPTPFDRILATRFGVAAVNLIAKGGFGQMVCLRNERIGSVDIGDAVGQLKSVDPQGELVSAARAIGICFGD
jgi:6-phosphofructokinase 1